MFGYLEAKVREKNETREEKTNYMTKWRIGVTKHSFQVTNGKNLHHLNLRDASLGQKGPLPVLTLAMCYPALACLGSKSP